jgi:16S rRNA (adenine1518-N6/adenine1519-N6)-dimethyltransferase
VKLSEIRSTLSEIRVSPVKTLGQNFLHDQNLSRWIVQQAEIIAGECVVEIGPGLGALTDVLLTRGAHVLAIEKDARLAKFLSARFSTERLRVLHSDALDFDVRTLFTEPRAKLSGNLPYNVATPLLLKYLAQPSPFSLVILMLQREMAERLCAVPATKSYGALTLHIQFHYRVKYLRTIGSTVFFPQPEVDSAVVLLQPRDPETLPFCDHELFLELVRCGFSQRRKQLGKLLRDYVRDWDLAATTLRLDGKARAETLTLEQWVALTNYVRPLPLPDNSKNDSERFPVVDGNDAVLADAPRAEVHANNLRHRAVHVLVFNRAGEVFLQKRSRWKDRHPLVWDSSAAGHVNAGEDYDLAAERELEEELGTALPLQRVVKLPASERTGQEFIWLYRGEAEGPFRLNRAEIESGSFFPPALVSGWMAARPGDFAPGFIECWKAGGFAAP